MAPPQASKAKRDQQRKTAAKRKRRHDTPTDDDNSSSSLKDCSEVSKRTGRSSQVAVEKAKAKDVINWILQADEYQIQINQGAKLYVLIGSNEFNYDVTPGTDRSIATALTADTLPKTKQYILNHGIYSKKRRKDGRYL